MTSTHRTALAAGAFVAGVALCGGTGYHPAFALTPASPAVSVSGVGRGDPGVGEPFTIATSKTTFSVTVDSVTCGALDARIMTAFFDSIGEPPTPPPPQPGHQWCVLQVHALNTGHVNDAWFVGGSAVLGAGQDSYKADTTSDGFTIGQAYENSNHGKGPENGLNPHESGPDWAAYQLPTGTVPSSVTVANGDLGFGPGSVVVTLRHS